VYFEVMYKPLPAEVTCGISATAWHKELTAQVDRAWKVFQEFAKQHGISVFETASTFKRDMYKLDPNLLPKRPDEWQAAVNTV